MLRLILDRGAAAIPPESMFLTDVAAARRAGDLAQPAQAEELMSEVWNHPRVRLWGLGAEPPAVPVGLTDDEVYRYVVTAPFAAYAAREGKTRWGDKTPAYLPHVDELAEVWPEARFVILVRDGRDVALSVKRLPFGANNAWAAARSWKQAVQLGQDAQRRYPDRVLTVRYEDLVGDPGTHVERVCAFLSLEYDPQMLAIERTDTAKILQDQSGWFTNVWAGINTTAVGKWRREMTPGQVRTFEGVAGDELRDLGYATVTTPTRSPPLAPSLYAGHDASLRAVNFVRLRLVQERGREVRYVLRRKLARTWR
jgi:Sulfotransferase family